MLQMDYSRKSLIERTQSAVHKMDWERINSAVQQCVQCVGESADKGNWACFTTLDHPIQNIECLRNRLRSVFLGCDVKVSFDHIGKVEVMITWS